MRPSESGQLVLPILAVLLLFGLFWVTYVLWCRTVYWHMRMDVAADATALSAAREQAALLNYVATFQTFENPYLPEFKDYGVMQLSAKAQFDELNQVLQWYEESFGQQVLYVAQCIAKANGGDVPAFPTVGSDFKREDDFDSRLQPHSIKVLYLYGVWPAGSHTYEAAYYTRSWSPDKIQAQPPHQSRWTVCRTAICENGRARLWLDVDSSSALDNGGFPPEKRSLWRSLGIQCFYPQFNARLMAKS